MNILQAHKYYWHRDGASNYMLYLSRLLEGRGETVVPFAMKEKRNLDSPFKKYFVSEMHLDDPAQASFSKKIRYAARMIYSHEAKKNMRALLDKQPIDIVHLHNIYHHISPSILSEIKKRGIPVVMTLHDYKLLVPNYTMFHHGRVHEEDGRRWYLSCVKNKCMKDSRLQSAIVTAEMVWHHKVMRYYERYVDMFIAPSQFIMEKCIEFGWSEDRFVHIPHPIDTERFGFDPKDRGYVAYVGRLSEEKGLDVLLSAAKRTPDIPYRIVGSGPMERYLHARADRERIQNVSFDGFTTGDALTRIVNGARIIILPSIWYENYPLSILEAKASGSLAIGSDIGGIPELLESEFLAPPHDDETLAKRIASWYTAPFFERKKVAVRQRKEVRDTNNPKKHVQEILSLYESLLR